MPFANTSAVRLCLRRTAGADQVLQVRLRYFNRLISRSPFAGLPYAILQETSSTPMEEIHHQFPLPLRELEDPLFCHAYVLQLLPSFDLGSEICDAIAREITSSVVQLAAENYDVKFHLVAEIDYIQTLWIDERRKRRRSSIMDGRRDVVIVGERAIVERGKKRKLDEIEQEELEECSVCYEEMKGKELAIIPCGHYYHKSCIFTWLQMANSCPLCRYKLEDNRDYIFINN